MDDDLAEKLDALRPSLPEQVLALPKEEQDAYLLRLVRHFEEQEKLEKEKEEIVAKTTQKVETEYSFLHPDLKQPLDYHYDAALLSSIRSGDPSALSRLFHEAHDGVFSFHLFSPSFCSKLCEEIDHFEKWVERERLDILRPNSMNNYGLVLSQLGMNKVMDDFVAHIATPISRLLFPFLSPHLDLDEQHSFIVQYEVDKDKDLGFHVDDSEVTFNCCLGVEGFEGGDLYMRGRRCHLHQQTEARDEEKWEYQFEVGQALVHLGRHRHGVLPLSKGKRQNLIVWCRSTQLRHEEDLRLCTRWCTYHPHADHEEEKV
eukprot:CAMPEP_0113880314 /NCGR_PEP_ID=MMETSP0780_2-20120614/7715_1 /TAXON_ID=652834 /ORGANISM="Palpitomonas bilix" /LENGTH=315 /DNA_ID=CAMNT_0000866973 /DNA_START=135 /DNA_END=1082 /DNA_ORIENTATION=- /assembly_acc=CAM_ASM_000599